MRRIQKTTAHPISKNGRDKKAEHQQQAHRSEGQTDDHQDAAKCFHYRTQKTPEHRQEMNADITDRPAKFFPLPRTARQLRQSMIDEQNAKTYTNEEQTEIFILPRLFEYCHMKRFHLKYVN